MRTMPAGMLELLKSKKQVGVNRPTAQILLGGGPSANRIKWNDPTYLRAGEPVDDKKVGDEFEGGPNAPWTDSNGLKVSRSRGGHFVKRDDGKFLTTYAINDNEIMLSVVDTEEQLLTHHNASKKNEWLFLKMQERTSVASPSKLLRMHDGTILLFVVEHGRKNSRPFSLDVYKSQNKLGTDFQHLSTIYTMSYDLPLLKLQDSAHGDVTVGMPMLSGGRIILPCNLPWLEYFSSYGGGDYLCWAIPHIAYSDDGGNSWSVDNMLNIIPRDGLPTAWRYFESWRSIGKIGNSLYGIMTNYWGGADTFMIQSSDNGSSWSIVDRYYPSKMVDSYQSFIAGTEFDEYAYLIFHEYHGGPDFPSYHIYRRSSADPLPSGKSAWTRGNEFDRTLGGTATWEWIGGPLGDDLIEFVWSMESGNVIFGGTSHLGGGSVAYFLNGEQNVQDVTPNVKSISVKKSHATPVSSASVEFDNIRGIYAPNNENSPWKGVFMPNTTITIKQGYGKHLVTTFKGFIDVTSMSSFPQTIEITCRDRMKLAFDGIIRKLTYKKMNVEDIVVNLAIRSGMSKFKIDKTGMKVEEKTFEWESYGDAIDWLAELVGFSYWLDEDDVFHFEYEKDTTEVSYIFREGEDITKMGYEIDDKDQYRKIIVVGQDANKKAISAEFNHPNADFLRLPKDKIMKVDVQEKVDVHYLKKIADRLGNKMLNRLTSVTWTAIANPWLQVGDVVQVIEQSTQSTEGYRILDINYSQDKDEFVMKFTAFHYTYKDLDLSDPEPPATDPNEDNDEDGWWD